MEIWKKIKYFTDYEASNLGRVKSLKFRKERILKAGITSHGYFIVNLNGKMKTVHQVVAIAFLNHNPSGHKLVVNHKDHNKLNNHVSNLEIITTRENTNKKHIKSSSKYTGVCWNKRNKKWQANIMINGKSKHLGYFASQIEASNEYKKALN